METKIELKNASITYRVHLEKTTSAKEWLVQKMRRNSSKTPYLKAVNALQDINLTMEHGSRTGIIGLNGAGKSTMLKLISGLIQPTEGSITVQGQVQPLIEIGAGFNLEFTGRENIYFNGAMLGFSKKDIKTFESEVIEFSELSEAIDMPVKYYSSGMVTRLAFSIATTIKPEILALDEMLSAGDSKFVNKARNRMIELIDGAKMLVLVSHNLSLVNDLCDRAIVLEKGTIAFDGSPDDAIAFYNDLVKSTKR